MKRNVLTCLIFLNLILVSSVHAAPPPIAYEIEADYQQTQSLPNQSFQQGAGVRLRYKLTSNGGYLDLSGLTGKWQGRSSATSTNYITQTTATTVTSTTPDYIQFDLDYTATGTAVTNWVYSMIVTSDGNDYVMGEGRLDIQASAWTGAGAAMSSGSYVSSLIAGTGITLSPTSGVGAVTVSAASASTAWGAITGTLSDQTDLNTELTNRYTKAESDSAFATTAQGALADSALQTIVGLSNTGLVNDAGYGVGDFLAGGTVPMTGDLNMGGQSVTNTDTFYDTSGDLWADMSTTSKAFKDISGHLVMSWSDSARSYYDQAGTISFLLDSGVTVSYKDLGLSGTDIRPQTTGQGEVGTASKRFASVNALQATFITNHITVLEFPNGSQITELGSTNFLFSSGTNSAYIGW